VQTDIRLAPSPTSRPWLTIRRRRTLEGYLFLLPWALGLLLFIGGPMVASLGLSLTRYNIAQPPQFVGLDNYVRALTRDQLFWPSLGRTFLFAFVMVPLGVTTSLLLASLLNVALKGTRIYRTLYFLPHLIPGVAAAIVWRAVLQRDVGVLNQLLALVGVRGPSWMGTVEWAIPAVMLIALWQNAGGNRMIIFVAGLQGVPHELYEAAEIDGAGAWAKFQHVTIPMISPAIFFNLVLGVIGALKVFTIAFVATKGGPAYATWFFALHIYTQAFEYFNLGYAAALSWVFFVIMLAFTFAQFRVSRHWVYYSGEDRA